MNYTYESHVKPFSEIFKLIEVQESELKKINEFVMEVVKYKNNESHHKRDNRSEYKRFFNGTLGEVALEKYLGIEGIVDWTIGSSNLYHKPDLKNIGLKVGVKTVEYGLFPVIFKNSYSPEIINISYKRKYVYICGFASVNVLNNYQSLDLIKDARLRARGTKTGFYGFEHLQKFDSLDELKKLMK